MMIKETDLAWIAGFFDGEGCIGIRKRIPKNKNWNPIYRVYLSIVQVDPKPLEKIQGILGGSFWKDKSYRGPGGNFYFWEISGQSALDTIKLFKDYTISKKEELETALLLDGKFKVKGNHIKLTEQELEDREFIYKKLKELKNIKYNHKRKRNINV
jgi:hypothetical protein